MEPLLPPSSEAEKQAKIFGRIRFLALGLGAGTAAVLLLVAVISQTGSTTALNELQRGDCFNTAKVFVVDRTRRVSCSAPHRNEVAGVLAYPATPTDEYPGETRIMEFGRNGCVDPVASFYGTRTPSPTTQVFILGPNSTAWKKGQRAVVCTLREETGAKRTGSYWQG